MNILFQDEYLIVVDKPAGHFVHPPEASRFPVNKEKICIFNLQKSLGFKVFPAHRLDAPTSGVLLFSKAQHLTRELGGLFQNREVKKTYHAVARGFVDPNGEINIPLEIAGFDHLNESKTIYRCLGRAEFNAQVGKKYPTARYSLVEVRPETGRWHQIRRHFDRIAHPLLGDIEHGDSHHNRFFRDELKISGLCLRATRLEFIHPWSKERIDISAPINEKWARIYNLFGQSFEGGLQ